MLFERGGKQRTQIARQSAAVMVLQPEHRVAQRALVRPDAGPACENGAVADRWLGGKDRPAAGCAEPLGSGFTADHTPGRVEQVQQTTSCLHQPSGQHAGGAGHSSSKKAMRRNSRYRYWISSIVSRRIRSRLNSSTLKEASTLP